MKLLIQTAMIFFGTLLCAAVVALGEPGKAEVALVRGADRPEARSDFSGPFSWIRIASTQTGFGLR